MNRISSPSEGSPTPESSPRIGFDSPDLNKPLPPSIQNIIRGKTKHILDNPESKKDEPTPNEPPSFPIDTIDGSSGTQRPPKQPASISPDSQAQTPSESLRDREPPMPTIRPTDKEATPYSYDSWKVESDRRREEWRAASYQRQQQFLDESDKRHQEFMAEVERDHQEFLLLIQDTNAEFIRWVIETHQEFMRWCDESHSQFMMTSQMQMDAFHMHLQQDALTGATAPSVSAE